MKMNLTSLMDVFTILVFFLLVNSATTEVLETPKQIKLPTSVVEDKPRETVVIFVSPEEVTVQGESVALVADIVAAKGQNIEPIGARLAEINENIIGLSTKAVAREPGSHDSGGPRRALQCREEGDVHLHQPGIRTHLPRGTPEGSQACPGIV